MNCILTAYSRQTYHEYRLPCQNGGTLDIPLPETLTGRKEAFWVSLHWQSGRLELLPSRAYTLRPARGKRRFPLPLEEDNPCFLKPGSGGGRIVLTVRAAEDSGPAFLGYSLENNRVSSFTIGSAPGSTFTYSGGGTVSPVHAVLTAGDGGHRLEDRSCNGVYVNHKRLEGSTLLSFGDQIHIMGLLLVYLGHGLAVETAAPGLRVQEGLSPLTGGVFESDLSRALALHGFRQESGPFRKAASGPENATVLTGGNTAEKGTVLLDAYPSEAETVLEEIDPSEAETVLEEIDPSEAETVLEEIDPSEAETVLEDVGESENRTILQDVGEPEDRTVLQDDSEPEGETVLQDGGEPEDKTAPGRS